MLTKRTSPQPASPGYRSAIDAAISQCDLKLSRKFSPNMMMITRSTSTMNIATVPARSRANVRRLMSGSWQGVVVLPVADELDQRPDLHLAEDARGVGLLASR